VRTPEYIIKIAADSVQTLRRSDVFRVLDNCDGPELRPTAEHITTHRADLSDEVSASLNDILDRPFAEM